MASGMEYPAFPATNVADTVQADTRWALLQDTVQAMRTGSAACASLSSCSRRPPSLRSFGLGGDFAAFVARQLPGDHHRRHCFGTGAPSHVAVLLTLLGDHLRRHRSGATRASTVVHFSRLPGDHHRRHRLLAVSSASKGHLQSGIWLPALSTGAPTSHPCQAWFRSSQRNS